MNSMLMRVLRMCRSLWITRKPPHIRIPVTPIKPTPYANRYGNGNASTGDGWRYRGRGLKQITFRANYRECGHALDLDLVARPELLERDEYAALSAGWYWWAFGLGKLADAGKFDEITRRINGPAMEGAEPRRARWAVAKQALGA
ncbi:glycoside hydrolase family 19 protein [Ralstonia sp. L16]|uniref:glycoside hydrolase family 19 protein n=1 Tax=Ralstonia sp. L16 TaxID=3423950 RepID=UPI003F79EE9E